MVHETDAQATGQYGFTTPQACQEKKREGIGLLRIALNGARSPQAARSRRRPSSNPSYSLW